jgi:hypothetical protein
MKPTRRRGALQPATGIDRAALLDPVRRRTPRKFERPLQAALVQFHATAVANPCQAILFAVPNGEDRDPAIAAMLSGRRRRHPDLPPETDEEAMRPAGQGQLPGVVDLVLLLAGPLTILIEVKAPKTADYRGGVLSPAQKTFRRAVMAMGYAYALVESVGQYQKLLMDCGVRLRPSRIERMEIKTVRGCASRKSATEFL